MTVSDFILTAAFSFGGNPVIYIVFFILNNLKNNSKNLYLNQNDKKHILLEVPGFEPGTFRMRSGRSTTELHPHQCRQPSYSVYKNNSRYTQHCKPISGAFYYKYNVSYMYINKLNVQQMNIGIFIIHICWFQKTHIRVR